MFYLIKKLKEIYDDVGLYVMIFVRGCLNNFLILFVLGLV